MGYRSRDLDRWSKHALPKSKDRPVYAYNIYNGEVTVYKSTWAVTDALALPPGFAAYICQRKGHHFCRSWILSFNEDENWEKKKMHLKGVKAS